VVACKCENTDLYMHDTCMKTRPVLYSELWMQLLPFEMSCEGSGELINSECFFNLHNSTRGIELGKQPLRSLQIYIGGQSIQIPYAAVAGSKFLPSVS
jgi:hypothetical protein